eukprot:scaffold309830_cov19-Tisochrysis_lutea.AAC.1
MFGHWDWIVAVQIVTKPVVFREASPCLLYEQYHVLPTTCVSTSVDAAVLFYCPCLQLGNREKKLKALSEFVDFLLGG